MIMCCFFTFYVYHVLIGLFACFRQQLKKQIQQLEKYLHATSVYDDRKMSHFSASTAAPRVFQYETPPTVPFKIDPRRLDSQFQENNEPYGFDRWGSSSASFSTDGFGASNAPVEREPYVPKYIEINYTDGSTDKKWSIREFSWTKKLEVFIECHLSFRIL